MNLVRSLFTPPTQRTSVRAELVRAPMIGPASAVAVRSAGVAQLPDWDALTAVHQGYLANYVVYRCVQINARKIASLPFRAGKVAPDPGDAGEAIPTAPLALKLGPPPGGPNPDTAPSVLWTHSIAQRQITGRFAWEIEQDGKGNRPPVALWPLISQYLRPVPAGVGETVDGIPRYFTKYEYNPGGQRRDMAWNQVYYDWTPSQYDFHQPESPLQAARLEIGAAVLQDLYDTAFLKNGGVPAYVVVTQAFEDPETRERFRAQFDSEYKGATKAGKTAFAESLSENAAQSFDIKTIGETARNSQALEKYRENLEGIAITLGVPWGKLSTSNRTFSNADTDDLNWEMDTIVPMCVEVAENINIRLAPMFGKEQGWFDMSGLKCFQKKKQYTPVSPLDAHAAGEISLNEARVALGEDPVDGGDDIPALTVEEQPAEPAMTANDVQAAIDQAMKALPAAPVPAKEDPVPKPAAVTKSRETAPALVRESDSTNDDVSSGVIAAFWLTSEQASEMAVPGYELPEQLHVTLSYLGKTDQDIDRQAVENAISTFAQQHGPIDVTVAATDTWDTKDGIAVVALLDSPDLMEFRAELVQVIEDAGATVDRTYDFTPHITLAYVDSETEAASITGPVGYSLEWDRVAFAWGPERTFFPLTATDRAKEAAATREQRWRSVDVQAVGIENTWFNQLDALIARQERAVIANLKGKRARQAYERDASTDVPPDATVVYDQQFWTAETSAIAAGIFTTIMAMAVGNAVRDIGQLPVDFALTSAVVLAFINGESNRLAKQITDTTFRTIQDQLIEGINAGEGVAQLAERLRGLVGLDPIQARALVKLRKSMQAQVDAGKITQAKADWLVEQKRMAMHDYRLSRIARTETIPKYSAANELIARFYPSDIVAGTGWLSAHDSLVRPEHRIADGQQRRIGNPFNVGPYLMLHPGDMSLGAPIDQLMQCRCTTRLIGPKEFEERAKNVRYIRVSEVQKELARISLDLFRLRAKGFNPDEPRDDDGQWTDEPGGLGEMSFSSVTDADNWARNTYANWADGLSDGQVDALRYYKDSGFPYINKYWRARQESFGFPSFFQELEGKAQLIDQAMKSSPLLPHDVIVYRGIENGELTDLLLEGAEIQDRGYQSTSLVESIAHEFIPNDGVLAVIKVPKGSRVVAIETVAPGKEFSPTKQSEAELLLDRGGKFKVTRSYKDSKGQKRVDLELVSQEQA